MRAYLLWAITFLALMTCMSHISSTSYGHTLTVSRQVVESKLDVIQVKFDQNQLTRHDLEDLKSDFVTLFDSIDVKQKRFQVDVSHIINDLDEIIRGRKQLSTVALAQIKSKARASFDELNHR